MGRRDSGVGELFDNFRSFPFHIKLNIQVSYPEFLLAWKFRKWISAGGLFDQLQQLDDKTLLLLFMLILDSKL